MYKICTDDALCFAELFESLFYYIYDIFKGYSIYFAFSYLAALSTNSKFRNFCDESRKKLSHQLCLYILIIDYGSLTEQQMHQDGPSNFRGH